MAALGMALGRALLRQPARPRERARPAPVVAVAAPRSLAVKAEAVVAVAAPRSVAVKAVVVVVVVVEAEPEKQEAGVEAEETGAAAAGVATVVGAVRAMPPAIAAGARSEARPTTTRR
jgi:hypothetical protein